MPPSPPRSPWRSPIPRPATSAAAASCSSRPDWRRPCFEYRETAPAPRAATCSPRQPTGTVTRPSACPARVRGLALAHKKFGKLPWKDLVMPAVQLAEDGFILDAPLAKSLNDAVKTKGGNAEFRRVFGKDGGKSRGKPATGSCSRTWRRRCAASPSRRAGRLLHGRDRRPARRRDESRRRLHHARATWPATRPTSASRSTAPIAATTSTARRRPAPAASAWSRCSTSWRTSTCKKQGRWSPETLHRDDRGDAPRLLRPRPLPRRSRLRPRFPTHLTHQGLRRKLARRRIDLDKATPSEDAGQRHSAGDGGRQHHALLRHRQGRHGRRQHLHAGSTATARASSSAAPASCSTTR